MIKKKRIARLSPDFGKRLALVRQMARLSQEAFAKSLGIKSQQAYQHYENGRMPPFNMLVRLAKQYGVSLDYLVMDMGEWRLNSTDPPMESDLSLERRVHRSSISQIDRLAVMERRDRFLGLLGTRSVIMGILNVTPDSFSDGGKFFSLDAAMQQAEKLAADGADIIDVGAESTRPGHTPVAVEEELARLEPILGRLASCIDVPFSIDTTKAKVARRATELGASVVNDVWGLQKDPAMADTVAETGAAAVLMHNRDGVDPGLDIVADMRRFFDRSLRLAGDAGIPRARLILDPGIGFGKSRAQNFTALANLAALMDYGLPILVGVSRKSLLVEHAGTPVDTSLVRTLAANLAAATNGASIFRVHDAAEHVAAFKVFDAIARR
jgi:dihydropteroate synthase